MWVEVIVLWTSAVLQNYTGIDMIHSEPDVIQNQYQDLF